MISLCGYASVARNVRYSGSREVNRMEARRQDKLTKTGEEPAQPKKKPYATPRLVVYGDVEQLTRAGAPVKPPGNADAEDMSAANVLLVQ